MLLETLSNAFGPSGCEDEVRRLLARALHDKVDDLQTDALGNLIAFKQGIGAGPRLKVMIDAHTDEVGLMITRIEKNGMLGFQAVGGIDPRLLMAKGVVVGEGRIPGVIIAPPVHLTKAAQRKQVIEIDQLVIDIGTSTADKARELVQMGDYAVFDTRFQVLSEDGLRTAKGKAFDDRIGCAVAAALADGEYPVDLCLSFSAQEEVGLRGARVAAFRIEPDLALALEGTVCDDTPKKEDVSPTTELGKGPAITVSGPFLRRRQTFGAPLDRGRRCPWPALPNQTTWRGGYRCWCHSPVQGRRAVGRCGRALSLHSCPGEHGQPQRL